MNSIDKVWFRPAASIVGLALFLVAAVSISAQQTDPVQQPDPGMRAVRLGYVEGAVQLTQGNQVLADPALANTPLFEGTTITTKEDGRAELQFEDGSIARVSPNSALKIAALRQQGGTGHTDLVLESGLAYFEFQGNSSAGQMTARFGNSTVTATGFTVLRIDMDDPPGELAVFSGSAHLDRGGAVSVDLRGGESIALSASDPNQYNLSQSIEPNSWDAWNSDRDQELTSQEAQQTVATSTQPNSNNPAWSDLDANGDWYNVPGQGYVWSPYAAADTGWDPYGCGNWVWTPQFGYVWVSCESWGYLPYTTGYWNFYDGFGWGWCPGYGYNPWWSTGGWAWNVRTRPARYEPPHRPHGGPVHPPNVPIHRGGSYQPNPVITVNRLPHVPIASPIRVVGRPVNIAGNTVEPIKPIAPRPVYGHQLPPSGVQSFRGGSVTPPSIGNQRPGYVTPRNAQPGYVPWANTPGPSRSNTWTMPAVPSGGVNRTATGTPYSGGVSRPPATSVPRVNPGGSSSPRVGGSVPAPHVSGGGGGAAPRPSSGGGGGGSSSRPSSGGHH